MQTNAPYVRNIRETLLSDNWYTLKTYTFELLRRDGRWQEQSREAYDRGNGAVILLYSREKKPWFSSASSAFRSGLTATTDF